MTKDEALKLALEALEEVVKWYQARDKDDKPMPPHNQNPEIKQAIETINVIKEALAQPEPVAWEQFYPDIGKPKFVAQLEQEPVAWMFQHDETGRMNYVSNDGIHDPTMFLGMNPRYALVCPLYTTPPQPKEPEQEPIGYVNEGETDRLIAQKQETIEGLNRDYDLLFAEHQLLLKKEWIELTDEEIKSCWNWETDCQEWAIEFARAILRKAQKK